MFGFGKRDDSCPPGPQVSTKLCTEKFNGKYPHVGLYDCRFGKIWVCKPLSGQAIRTAHARLITGADNATSTVWKDRFQFSRARSACQCVNRPKRFRR